MIYRNWIEEALQKQITWTPVYIGSKGSRKLYEVSFADGTTKDFYIDFEAHTIEEA